MPPRDVDDQDERELVALVMGKLCAGTAPVAWPDPELRAVATSVAWQQIGTSATWAEMHGVRNGASAGRLSELFGRVAAAGEQLGLAWTCGQEAQRWLQPDQRQKSESPMGARALAEMTGYFSLGAAHGLGNVTLRSLLLAPAAAAIIDGSYRRATGFSPFSSSRDAWPPLNPRLVSVLESAATPLGQPSVTQLVATVGALVRDQKWAKLMSRRDIDFHRWRPQSVPGGVSTANPWEQNLDGSGQLTVYGTSRYEPPDAHALAAAAADGLDVLVTAMNQWLEVWPAALRDLGVPIFKT